MDDLTPVERVELLRVVLDELGGALPIIAGASSPTLAEAIARVQEVQSLGIRQVMIQAPKAIGTDAAAVTAFYAAIAEACPGIEIILQNAPAPRGSDLSPAAVLTWRVPSDHSHREGRDDTPGGPISAIIAGAPAHLAGVMGAVAHAS